MYKDRIDRREFLKRLSTAAAVSAVALTGCDWRNKSGNRPAAGEVPTDQMTYRINPNTGDKVSLLGYGMMRLPAIGGGTARDNAEAAVDQDLVNAEVDYAIAHGVNYFDTSPAYCQGLSERSTGIALARHPRASYRIATKMSNYGPATWPHAKSVAMFENSLKELQVDYIDYLLMHGIGMSAEGMDGMLSFYGRFIDNGILDYLVEQRTKGRIRHLGFSYHGDLQVFEMLLRWHDEKRYHWDFAQIEMNYFDWNHAEDASPRASGKAGTGQVRNTNASYLYEQLSRRNIPVTIMEPLLGGRLATLPDFIVEKMQRRRPGDSAARWAFRFAGTPKGVQTVLSGMTYMEHLVQNVETYSPLEPLTDEETAFLMEVADDIAQMKYVGCTGCNYCMPCPYGIDIPGVFAYYNRCVNEGYATLTPQTGDYRKTRRAFLIGYDRNIPKLRQSDHCIGCGQCMPHCPQGIQIPVEMQRIDRYVEELKRGGTF